MKRFALGILAAVLAGCSAPTAETPTETPAQTPAPETAAAPAATTPAETPLTAPASASAPAAVFAEDGIAIRGADPVAYFTEGEYVPGSAEFTHDWGGVTWQFASAAHRDTFAANPDQYAPQYGGFCAWAVSEGKTAPVDPTAWRIVDGKLYLNYSANIQRRWEQDIPGNIAKADTNWPAVLEN